jgi:6-phosphogluconolactonase
VYQYAHISGSGGETFELVDQRIVRAGAGPRHLAFHPDEPVAFLVGELDSTVLVLDVEPTTGRLSVRQTMSTVPDGFTGASIGAEVRVHPSGRVVYVSNRGHDSIAVFGFHGADVPLEALGHVPTGGRAPRNFAVHPSARSLLVANQNSNTLIPFELDADGHPHQLDVAYDVSEPVCVTFLEVAR